jgi:hypothetical protein
MRGVSFVKAYRQFRAAISFFLALTFSLNTLLVGLDLNRIPQHSQNNLSVKK